MDANVNIQVSGMNSSGLYEAGTGYLWFILRQIPDWVNNAAMVYGMKDAVLVPVNTDGHRAMMVEDDIYYPFQYWQAGAGWMLITNKEVIFFTSTFLPVLSGNFLLFMISYRLTSTL